MTVQKGQFLLLMMLGGWMLTGCVVAGPRFSPDVQQSFARDDMQRLETERLKVYYPARRRDEALRIAHRLEGCLMVLEEVIPRPTDWGLVPVFITESEFNNAYVSFGPGNDPHMVLPTSFSSNLFGELGFTPSIAAVSCHELVHYVHFTQVHGLYGIWNRLVGTALTPQMGFDSWFFEGLATYYESQLVEDVGRYGSPIWENYFAAGLHDGHFDGGRLSVYDRAVPFGGHYLVGSQFVGYLVDEYGEERLWELIDRQGRSIVFPLGVSLRFLRVYGKSLGRLLDDFEEAMRDQYPQRSMPEHLEQDRWVGRGGALETGPGERWALFSRDVDQVARLEVFEGEERILKRELPDVLPGRKIVASSSIEALRFSKDGKYLYLLVYHLGRDRGRTSLMRLLIERNRLEVLREDVRAVGGDLFPEGERYLMVQADGSRSRFVVVDLNGGAEDDEVLFEFPSGAYVGWVRISPDTQRVAFTLMEDEEWTIALVELSSGELLGKWTTGEAHVPVFDPTFLDNDRLLFVGGISQADGTRSLQVFEGDHTTGKVYRRSEAPYMAYNPRVQGREVEGELGEEAGLRFLNRDGWGWALVEQTRVIRQPSGAVRWVGPEDPSRRAIHGYDSGHEEEARELSVVDDHRYRWWDGLFLPRLRIPSVGTDFNDVWVTGSLSGRDELGFHNWALTGRYELLEERVGGSFSYTNTQLAPWYVGFTMASEWQTLFDTLSSEDPQTLETVRETTTQGQRSRLLRLQVERDFYDRPLRLSMQGLEVYREETGTHAGLQRRLVGPSVGTGYQAGRSSAYGGAQWFFGAEVSGSLYPAELGSDFTLGDGRAEVAIHTPLPFSRRHRLRIRARGRGLSGVGEGEELLQVGGFVDLAPIYSSNVIVSEEIADRLPPGVFLRESLRGYEDRSLAANQAAMVDLNYRLPVIVDRGAASVLWVFPAVFFRQIHLEGFFSGATLFDGDYHGAVGLSADASFVLWSLPLQLRYQVAQRLFDDQRRNHVVGLGSVF